MKGYVYMGKLEFAIGDRVDFKLYSADDLVNRLQGFKFIGGWIYEIDEGVIVGKEEVLEFCRKEKMRYI